MGVRLLQRELFSNIPVECIDGILKFSVLDVEVKLEIPRLKGLVFERQCTMHKLENVFCYIANETYQVVLYFDGSATILHKRVVVTTFDFDIPELPKLERVQGSPLLIATHKYNYAANVIRFYELEESNGKVLLVGEEGTFSAEMSIKDNEAFYAVATHSNAYPGLFIDREGKIKEKNGDVLGGYTVFCDYTCKPLGVN